MNLNSLIFTGFAAGLSACVAAPVAQSGAPVQAGAFVVAHEGASYQAQVYTARPGHALTKTGSASVAGSAVRVSPFAYDQGRRAKAVATAACAQAQGRFQPQALGRFQQGAWVFEGGCA